MNPRYGTLPWVDSQSLEYRLITLGSFYSRGTVIHPFGTANISRCVLAFPDYSTSTLAHISKGLQNSESLTWNPAQYCLMSRDSFYGKAGPLSLCSSPLKNSVVWMWFHSVAAHRFTCSRSWVHPPGEPQSMVYGHATLLNKPDV
uniref:Uncharacterized protein n=1 Tax=Rousettus aegyptiacus TaxID=9407 RepID=A0A7J8EZZ8_ROUAE|nr:hypothetical protein HJG63_012277 [Rousettus aegyptiacus]